MCPQIIRVLKGDQYLVQDDHTSTTSDLQEDCVTDSAITIKSTCDSGLASIPMSVALGEKQSQILFHESFPKSC